MALLTLTTARSASADEKPTLAISVADCGNEGAVNEVKRIAAIELHATIVEGAAAPRAVQISVVCAGDDTAELRVVDSLTSKSLTRTVSVADTSVAARPRLLALAVTELVGASWAELASNPEPRVPPTPPRAPPAMRAGAALAIARLPLLLEAVADARVFFDSRDLLLGGGVRFTPWLARGLVVSLDVLANHADTTRRPGDVTIDAVSAGVAVGTGYTWSRARLTATLGLRAGVARIVGTLKAASFEASTLSGAWLGPELAVHLELLPHARVHPIFVYAVGWAVAGVDGRVPDDRDVKVEGAWGALSVGAVVD
jgi:hypothetical protein